MNTLLLICLQPCHYRYSHSIATVTRLLESTPNVSPAYFSTNGVTLGGQTFDTSTNGVIQGNAYGEVLTPAGTTYTIALPVTSAALITIPHN